MRSDSFGLEIRTDIMRALWLKRDKDVLAVGGLSTAVPPPSGIVSEAAVDQQKMAQAIAEMVTNGKIGVKKVSIALADNQVYTKVIDMPSLSDKELASAIRWEAEQHIPVPLDTITLDWKILRRQKETKTNVSTMQVLLVAAPIGLIRRYEKIISLAGLTISSVETEILSVIRSIVVGDDYPTSVIVNINNTSTTLAIVQANTLIFTYLMPLGSDALDRAIAAEFGFSLDQAEEYRRVYGVSEQTFGGKLSRAMEPILMSLVSEVKRALTFYSERYKNEYPIYQIIICGSVARLPGMSLFFVQNSGIETVIANPWTSLGIAGVPEDIANNAAEYSVVVGLALKQYV